MKRISMFPALFCAAPFMARAITTTLEYEDRREEETRTFVTNALAAKADATKTVADYTVTQQTWWKFNGKDYWFAPDFTEDEWKFGASASGWPHLRYCGQVEGRDWWGIYLAAGDTSPHGAIYAAHDAEQLDFRSAMSGSQWLLTRHVFEVTNTTHTTVSVVYSDDLAAAASPIRKPGETNILDGVDWQTGYLYDGVSVVRGGQRADYLYGTTNEFGVVRFRDLEPIITSICLSLIGNIYWQSDDGGRTMDAYYRDPETISNIVSTAVAYIAETRASAFLRIEDGAAVVYQPDEQEMGGVADRNQPTNTVQEVSQ